jgi:hypothetical protein
MIWEDDHAGQVSRTSRVNGHLTVHQKDGPHPGQSTTILWSFPEYVEMTEKRKGSSHKYGSMY